MMIPVSSPSPDLDFDVISGATEGDIIRVRLLDSPGKVVPILRLIDEGIVASPDCLALLAVMRSGTWENLPSRIVELYPTYTFSAPRAVACLRRCIDQLEMGQR